MVPDTTLFRPKLTILTILARFPSSSESTLFAGRNLARFTTRTTLGSERHLGVTFCSNYTLILEERAELSLSDAKEEESLRGIWQKEGLGWLRRVVQNNSGMTTFATSGPPLGHLWDTSGLS